MDNLLVTAQAEQPPRGALVEKLTDKLDPFVSTFLLPVFFAFSGLNTPINTLNSPWLWTVAGLLLLAWRARAWAACWRPKPAAKPTTQSIHPNF